MGIDFTGRRVVVSGGSRGIGRAIARGFAAAGARVSVSGRDAAALEETHAVTAEAGTPAHVAVCDVGDPAAVDRYIAEAAETLGGIDILVNNASAFARGDDDDSWNTAFSVDMMGLVRAVRAARPWLEAAEAAAIVNISSISAYHATPVATPYGAIKAAIVHYTTSLALALAPHDVRVNSVAPGSITFPGHFWEERRARNAPEYQHALARIPFGRLGAPEEIADPVLFLASPMARWITGQTLIVDGGQELPR